LSQTITLGVLAVIGAVTGANLIMVNNALIGTTEHDTFSVNPTTCAENWRTHEA
jgi:hypothetical protein